MKAIVNCIVCGDPTVIKIMHMYDRSQPPDIPVVCKKCSGISISNITKKAPRVKKYKEDLNVEV